ncbi:MAG TPA: polysaccharide biosynthesis/export family protein, partial [Thermoguttaceae bacterium]|nr:polysaccharide biosynthesis/export family protein [Thermoguttaceae bacterium]
MTLAGTSVSMYDTLRPVARLAIPLLLMGTLWMGASIADAQQPTPAAPGQSVGQFHSANLSGANLSGADFRPDSAQPYSGPYGFDPVPQARCGVACDGCSACGQHAHGSAGWSAQRPIPWQVFAQGEYVGPARQAHVPVYRLRVDDTVEFIYRLTARPSIKPYEFEVGDQLRVESLSAEEIAHELSVQPDGTITLPILGQVVAAGRTVDELRDDLEERFKTHIRNPAITVTPQKFNTRL